MLVDRLSWARDGTGPVEKGYTPRLHRRRYPWRHAAPDHQRQVQPQRIPIGLADGQTIYVSAIRKPDAEYLRNDSEIHAIDLKTLARQDR